MIGEPDLRSVALCTCSEHTTDQCIYFRTRCGQRERDDVIIHGIRFGCCEDAIGARRVVLNSPSGFPIRTAVAPVRLSNNTESIALGSSSTAHCTVVRLWYIFCTGCSSFQSLCSIGLSALERGRERVCSLAAEQARCSGLLGQPRCQLLPAGMKLCTSILLACASAALLGSVHAVDRSKFRTCQQTGFCRRHRSVEAEPQVRDLQGTGCHHAA